MFTVVVIKKLLFIQWSAKPVELFFQVYVCDMFSTSFLIGLPSTSTSCTGMFSILLDEEKHFRSWKLWLSYFQMVPISSRRLCAGTLFFCIRPKIRVIGNKITFQTLHCWFHKRLWDLTDKNYTVLAKCNFSEFPIRHKSFQYKQISICRVPL